MAIEYLQTPPFIQVDTVAELATIDISVLPFKTRIYCVETNSDYWVNGANVTQRTKNKQTTIDFGSTPINEKQFVINDLDITPRSTIILNTYSTTNEEENTGLSLDFSTVSLEGYFTLTAITKYPDIVSRGIFKINYTIN